MKKTFFFLLLTLLLTAALSASAVFALPEGLTEIDESAFEGDTSLTGRIVLPSTVQTVGAKAFANTSVHGLVLPAGCTSVDSTVLAQSGAAYLYLNSATTRLNATPADVAFVFAPAFGSASGVANFYATETLVSLDGLYYSVTEGMATPLCAVDSNVSGVVTLPKLVNSQPIRSLSALILNGCEGMTELRVPSYLTLPTGVTATPYATMSVASPKASVTSAEVGDTVTWTVDVTGAYGETAFVWDFTIGGTTARVITEAPTVSYTFKAGGDCTVTVTVTDEVGDKAAAPSAVFAVNGESTVYRALLIGNSYTGTYNELKGSATDVAGMRAMLGRMTATPYRISTKSELSADGIISAIRSTFADAKVNDVSLLYFAGHGTNALETSYHGSLLGTDGSYLTVARLRNVLDEIPGKKIVIVDACYSGQLIGKGEGEETVTTAELNAFNSNVVSAFSEASTVSRGANDLATSSYYVITAAHSTEESKSMGYDANGDGVMEKYFGLFTYSLCYGSGWNMATNVEHTLSADVDGNGQITLFEAYAFARNKALQSNPNQTAQVYPSNSTMVVWAK